MVVITDIFLPAMFPDWVGFIKKTEQKICRSRPNSDVQIMRLLNLLIITTVGTRKMFNTFKQDHIRAKYNLD